MDGLVIEHGQRDEMNISDAFNTSFEDLPDGLVIDILSRLPIIHSTCVCKSWYSIIKTPCFVPTHLTRSISDPSTYYIYLFRHNSPSITVVSDNNHLLTRHPDFVFPIEIESLKLIGACKGLVCVTEDYRDIYLFNPWIHKYKKLGFECCCYADWIDKFHHSDRLVDIKVGFGYSEVEDDYKLVRIFNRYPYRPDRVIQGIQLGFVLESKVEIYSRKRGMWRSLDLAIELSSDSCPVFVHGCLYWEVNLSSRPVEYLLCFDLKDEVFSKIELPKTYIHLHWSLDRSLLIKNGSVAVVAYDALLDPSIPCMKIYIFVLEENVGGRVRWKELYYECAALDVLKCIGFSGVGRLLFVGSKWGYKPNHVVAVHLDNSCAIEKLVMDSHHIRNGVTNISESLVLLMD